MNPTEYNARDVDLLVQYLLGHKMQFTKDFLSEKGLAHSYVKDDLITKIYEYLNDGLVTFEELVNLLNDIEGWGNQHVYLYEPQEALVAKWRDPEFVRLTLRNAGYEHLFNKSLPLVLPDSPTLSSIQWTPKRVRFIWVEKRSWMQEDKKRSYTEDDLRVVGETEDGEEYMREVIEFRAYVVRSNRGIVVFDWDLTNGAAMLLIQSITRSKKNSYVEARQHYENELTTMIDMKSFSLLRVSKAVRKLETSKEARKYQMKYRSKHRGQMTIASPTSDKDVFDDDPTFELTRQSLGEDTTGLLGYFYWQPKPVELTAEVYTQIYGEDDDDQRVRILAEHKEDNVRHVLRRIRAHCE